jgi:DNA invertase Pin-like site-specific DNA recombinase
MSEAELHVLEARLHGGIRNKARRGELEIPPPIGLLYGSDHNVILDPHVQIRKRLQVLFSTFRQTQSASAVVRTFRSEGWLFPRRIWFPPRPRG